MSQHGLGAREQQIMDLCDAGQSTDAITTALGLERVYVRQVVGRYQFGKLAREMSAIEAATRHADRLYQRALAASGGSYA